MSKPDWFKPSQFVPGGQFVCSCCGMAFAMMRDRESGRDVFTHESDFPNFCPNEGKKFAAPLVNLEEVI